MTVVRALLFDVFGTVVDWRGGLVSQLEAFGREQGVEGDWAALADGWRGAYASSMARVATGQIGWTNLEELQRQSLERLVSEHGIAGLSPSDFDQINRMWRRLPAWPDAPGGLAELRRGHVVAALSNGTVALLVEMARFAGLEWDMIFSTELFKTYKPDPDSYLGACSLLDLRPDEVLMCAAHEADLAAASALGLRTAYVHRPLEYGPDRPKPWPDGERWDFAVETIDELSAALSDGGGA